MVTKICVRNYIGDIYHHANPNRFRGFGSAHAWFRAPRRKVTRLFFWGSWEKLQPRRAHRFRRKIRQTTWFRARKCLLGVAKPKSKASIPIFHQKRHFWAPYLTEFFFAGRLENKRSLIVITHNSRTDRRRVFKLGRNYRRGVDACGILSRSVGQTNRK